MPKIKITIDIDGKDTSIKVPVAKAPAMKRRAKAARTDSTASDLELRLMTEDVDDMESEKAMSLNVDVMTYVAQLLKAKKKAEALKFLNDNKHRFNPALKDMLRSTIKENV